MLSLILAAAVLPSSIDAERAFARDAQRIGQWSAFRKYADRDAVMFTPQAVWARDFLRGRANPARSLNWWPTEVFRSCDGRTAVNLGAAVNGQGKPFSYFTTVWQRSGRNWRWVYDGGLPVDTKPFSARTLPPAVKSASCRIRAPGAPVIPPLPLTDKQARKTPVDNGRGESADKTLGWDWKVAKSGARTFRVFLWNGRGYDQVVDQAIPAE